jgi:hypothetical protein
LTEALPEHFGWNIDVDCAPDRLRRIAARERLFFVHNESVDRAAVG